jgi:hypothetical protein
MNPQPNHETPASINLKQLLDSIEHALRLRHYLPAQILIYAGIDAAAWLASDTNEGVGKRFRRWVDRWMLPAKPLLATASDLYAARCAVLHTFTADSDLSKTGTARRIAYATGQASAKELQAKLDAKGHSDIVVVHIADLYDAFRLGFAAYFDSLHSDPVACARTIAKMDRYTVHVEGEALREFLQ